MEVCCVKNFLNKLLAVSKNYTIADFAMFKTAVFCFGALFGMLVAGCKKCAVPIRTMLMAMAVVSWAYLIFKTFFEYWED